MLLSSSQSVCKFYKCSSWQCEPLCLCIHCWKFCRHFLHDYSAYSIYYHEDIRHVAEDWGRGSLDTTYISLPCEIILPTFLRALLSPTPNEASNIKKLPVQIVLLYTVKRVFFMAITSLSRKGCVIGKTNIQRYLPLFSLLQLLSEAHLKVTSHLHAKLSLWKLHKPQQLQI